MISGPIIDHIAVRHRAFSFQYLLVNVVVSPYARIPAPQLNSFIYPLPPSHRLTSNTTPLLSVYLSTKPLPTEYSSFISRPNTHQYANHPPSPSPSAPPRSRSPPDPGLLCLRYSPPRRPRLLCCRPHRQQPGWKQARLLWWYDTHPVHTIASYLLISRADRRRRRLP
jgi:hypothetical protein